MDRYTAAYISAIETNTQIKGLGIALSIGFIAGLVIGSLSVYILIG